MIGMVFWPISIKVTIRTGVGGTRLYYGHCWDCKGILLLMTPTPMPKLEDQGSSVLIFTFYKVLIHHARRLHKYDNYDRTYQASFNS